MKKYKYSCFLVLIIVLLASGCGKNGEDILIKDLTVCYRNNPVISESPFFSWKVQDTNSGQNQSAYRIVVSDSEDNLKRKKYVWDSGKIESDDSVGIEYNGDSLDAGKRYYWKVTVWDKWNNKNTSKENAFFEKGIENDDWKDSDWICVNENEKSSNSLDGYIIEYDLKMDDEAESGFVWGADDGKYGEHIICAVNTRQNAYDLILYEMNEEDIIEEYRFDLSILGIGKDDFFKNEHKIKIKSVDKNIYVIIDDIEIAKQEIIGEYNLGVVGFWTTRGAFYAYYDNVKVIDALGNNIFEENFESKDSNIFTPYFTKVRDGWMEASSGYILTPGWEKPAPFFRKEFTIDGNVASAKIYASALGIYQLYINGEKVGDEYFAPGQSVYTKEVYYQTYDITEQLNLGDNTIGVMLGHGRYDRAKTAWGDSLSFRGKIVIKYDDGIEQTIVSDSSWKYYINGPVRNDDMFMGEYYDSNYELEGWSEAEFSDENWEAAKIYTDEYKDRKLVAANYEPVRCVEELKPICISEPVKGVFVYDFGQNVNGFCNIKVKGKKGQVVTLRYAETLNEENMSCKDDEIGTVWTENLYTADNTDYYVFKGVGEENYEPTFVCRGFRYVQITGLEEAIPLEKITAKVLSSDLKRTGYFECSNEELNLLYRSIYWTQMDNFVDVPVDCPQRDERFGWAGDAQVFAKTAAYNANIYQFMRKYVTALRLGQSDDGAYPEIAPGLNMAGGSNGWSDAGIILVWELYQQYGDTNIIEENIEAMCKYMDYLVNTSEEYIREHSGYSDHNSVAELDLTLCNTAQCAYVASILSKMCTVLGKDDLAIKYDDIANKYKSAWQDKYINEDGTIDCWLQSAYTLGLAYDIYPYDLKAMGAKYLNSAVEYNEYHLNTGFVATPHLLQTLCDYGYVDTAYKILMQKSYPSWNNMFSYGATTITEAWNTYYDNEDGTYGINGSLNHYGLGAVGAWFYEGILGIKRDVEVPGFKHFYLQPIVGGGLTYAKGSYECIYGVIESEWRVEGNKIIFRFVVPANTTATLNLPDAQYQNLFLEAGEHKYEIVIN